MNKRWFALVLMMTLIPGCSGRKTEPAPSEALYETKPTDPVGFSSLSEVLQTDTAVQAVPLDMSGSDGFRFFGNDIVVFSSYSNTVLTLLDGCTLECKAEAVLPQNLQGVTVHPEAITYIDLSDETLVFLDSGLNETKRIPLPEHCTSAVLSADQGKLYCCSAEGIRLLDLESGIDRPLREMYLSCPMIIGLHCNDTILQCTADNEAGESVSFFLDVQTGRLIYASTANIPLWTEDDLYFSIHMDGEYRELLSGSRDFGPSVLVADSSPDVVTPLLSLRSVLLHRHHPEGTTVDVYHLETGIRSATLTLPDEYRIIDIQPNAHDNTIWFLCHNSSLSKDVLFRWNLSQSDPEDPRCYLQSRWSPENPDEAGLSQCRDLAAQLSEKHGVRILLWEDATVLDADNYVFTPEYQVPLILETLQVLDETLSCYPDGFLTELALATGSSQINVCLVRNIRQEEHFDEDLPDLLYWDKGNDIWLFVTPGQSLPTQLNSMLCNLIDNRILALSDTFDGWDRSHPEGSGHRERVWMMETAIAEGNAVCFSSNFMQAQLRLLCFGIRETFETANTTDQLAWEQYLISIS